MGVRKRQAAAPPPGKAATQNLNEVEGTTSGDTSPAVLPDNNLDAAVGYAQTGQIPVPLCWADPCPVPWHNPCDSPGKRPLVKIKDRNTVPSEDQIRRWWKRWPLAEVAILTGARSGVVVVDIDGPEGEEQWARVQKVLGFEAPPTMEVKTKRGRHLWFRDPNGQILTRRGDQFYPEGRDHPHAKGLDVRGEGGLVVAPPSRNRELVNDEPVAELPTPLVEPRSTRATAAASLDDQELTEALESIRTEGEPCPCMVRVMEKCPDNVTEKGRHGAMLSAQQAIVYGGREGHPGAGEALDQLMGMFLADKPDGEGEWSHALDGAVAAAMANEPERAGCPYVIKEHLADVGDGPSLNELLANHARQAEEKKQAPPKSETQQAVEQEATRLYIRESGRRLYESRIAELLPDPELTSLTDLLAEELTATAYRIDGLWPTGGNIILAAQRKAGKTTLVGNLARSLIDGEPFLAKGEMFSNGRGEYDVTPVDGMVGLLDLELGRDMLHRWMDDQNIRDTDRLMLESLRGRAHLFDILDDKRRQKWARLFSHYGVKVLILDPLGALLDAYGRDENSNSDVGPVLQALDALKAEAGIEELFLAHHMGHSGERSRGASKLRGWPDAEWFIVRERAANGEEPPPDSERFFRAEGRDVMVPETRLEYDQDTRRLWVAGGSRTQRKATKDAPAVLDIITNKPGLSQRDITAAAGEQDISRDRVKAALRFPIKGGKVRTETGARNALCHYPVQDDGPDRNE
jgi:hypothetical protein